MDFSELPLLGPEAYSPQWYSWRLYNRERTPDIVFGASDAASVCGLNRYRTPADLFLAATGQAPDVREEAVEMRLGKLLEPAIMQEYTNRTGNVCTLGHPLYIHHKHRQLGCTPDGMTREDGERVVVDAKSSTFRMYDPDGHVDKFGDDGTDEVPRYCYLQAQQQMLVMNANIAHYPTLFDGRTMRVYRIERNQEICNHLIEKSQDLLLAIRRGECPPIDYYHANAPDLLRHKYPDIDATEVTQLDAELTAKWHKAQELSRDADAMAEEAKALKNELKDRMGTAAFAHLDGVLDRQVKKIVIADSVWSADHLDGIELYRRISSDPQLALSFRDVLERYRENVLSRIGKVRRKGSHQLREVKRKS